MKPWLAWSDRGTAKIFLLGAKACKCATVAAIPGFVRMDGVCLGNRGQHFYCAIADESVSPEQAHAELKKLGAIILPPHNSKEPISAEAFAILQEHSPEVEVSATDTTKIVAAKFYKARGFRPLQLGNVSWA